MSERKNRLFMKKTKKCTVIRKSIAFMLLFQLVFAFIGGETINNKISIHETNSVGEYKSSLKDSKSNELGPKDALNQNNLAKPSITIGSYISLGKYEDKNIVWRCVDIDDNGPLFLADKIVDTLPYDAMTSDNSKTKSHSRNYKRDTYGSNYWVDSNMRSWLNSTSKASEVKWLCGNPPKSGYVAGNEYDGKAGFLNSFEKNEIAAMKTTTQKSIVSHPEYNCGIHEGESHSDLDYHSDIQSVSNNFDDAYYVNSTEKVFLLDVKQVNKVWANLNDYYIGRNSDGSKWPYWLRTPVTDCNHDMRYVHNNGSIGRETPSQYYIGVRPAFYLDTDYFLTSSGDGTSTNPYVGSAPNKVEADYTIEEPKDDINQEWNVSTEESIKLTLGQYYSSDGKYSNPTIPVYTIQKTRSDNENMVILICGEGYTKNQQNKFISDVKRIWSGTLQYEPYRSFADRFNVYALCTASESSFENEGSTFFDVIVGNDNSSKISTNMHSNYWKNHIFERCIGPEFIEKIHDAHVPNKTEPNIIHEDDYAPYRYVYNYINQFCLLVNTDRDFGDAFTNLDFGFKYFISPSDCYRATKTFAHELGHGLLGLGDEYMVGKGSEQTDLFSLNVAYTANPEKVKWKQMLGFRKTYTCPHQDGSELYNSSYECLMSDTNYSFCEVCRLQGFKRMSQLVEDGDTLYVADPEVREFNDKYTSLSDFSNTSISGYYSFSNYRNSVLLSGTGKNRFGNYMRGKKIELRTIVQNLSDTVERTIKMKVWIRHSDGTVATSSDGTTLETTQTYTIPTWGDKSKFWPKGAMKYEGSDMNSGLQNCQITYQIPSNAILKNGDTVAFEVTDENDNVLANDNTETQSYANVSIKYMSENGSEIPNTETATIPVAVGTTINWANKPDSLYGYKLVKIDGLNQTVGSDGLTITCYYEKNSEDHTHTWGDWMTDGIHHWRECSGCDEKLDYGEHTGGTATCISKAVCSICGKEYGELGEHNYGSLIPEVDSTTDKEGMKAHYYDSVCGKYFDENKNEVNQSSLVIPKKIVLTITGGSIEGQKEDRIVVNPNQTITLIAKPAEEGKEFIGWMNENGEMVIETSELSYSFKITNSQTLTAVYRDINKNNDNNNNFPTGAVIGIAVGSVSAVIIVGILLYVFVIKNKKVL